MSAPSTGVPAQGGVAPTAVEQAKEEIKKLQATKEKLQATKEKLQEEKEKLQAEQQPTKDLLWAEKAELVHEKKELRAQITALEKCLDGEDVKLEAAGVYGLDPQPTEDTVKGRLVELEERFKFVNKQLPAVNEQLASATKPVIAVCEQLSAVYEQLATVSKQLRNWSGILLDSARRATLSEDDQRDLLLARWARSLPMEAFNGSQSASSEASSEFRDAELVACVVCGKTDGLSRAHIIRSRRKCESLGLGYSDNSNVLVLCHSCQHMFDAGQMAFQHVRDKDGWVVWGGNDYHAKEPTFRNKPLRSALHAHLVRCLRNRSLLLGASEEVRLTEENVTQWLKDVTPTVSPENN